MGVFFFFFFYQAVIQQHNLRVISHYFSRVMSQVSGPCHMMFIFITGSCTWGNMPTLLMEDLDESFLHISFPKACCKRREVDQVWPSHGLTQLLPKSAAAALIIIATQTPSIRTIRKSNDHLRFSNTLFQCCAPEATSAWMWLLTRMYSPLLQSC